MSSRKSARSDLHPRSYERGFKIGSDKIYIGDPEKAVNAIICLINQTNQLLDQKMRWLEEKFVKEGEFREQLFKKRLEFRVQQGI